jgi:hypothetical protein
MRKIRLVALSLATILSGCGLIIGTGDFTDQEPSSTSSSSGGAECTAGVVKDCPYTGAGKDVGTCKAATQTCLADGTFGQCEGEVKPTAEDDCKSMPQRDTTCDGKITCPCTPGAVEPCYDGPMGTDKNLPCHAGTHTCDADGKGWGVCTGEVKPKTEDCATPEDDDCDGTPNQMSAGCKCTVGSMQQCYTFATGTPGIGICNYGTQTCNALGTDWDACVGDVGPQPAEDCATPVDDNCDNQINENCACAPGSSAYCYSGAAGTDSHLPCKGGTHICNPDGHGYGPCMGEIDPVPEDCATPVDENCNGVVNEAAAGCVCTPGTTAACYNGPPGTSGVGICADGQKTCDATGKAYLPGCANEVDPKPTDDCTNNLDDDCSGTYCTQALWVDDFAAGTANPRGVGLDGAGNVYVAGGFQGSIAIGANNLIGAGASDAFAAKFDSQGSVVWARQYGGANDQLFSDMAVDAAGNSVLVGTFITSITFDGVHVVNAQGTDAFVIKVDPQGTLVWAKVINEGAGQGNFNQNALGVAIDSSGNIVVAGDFGTRLDFGGGHVFSTASTTEAYVAKFDASGNYVWAVVGTGTGFHSLSSASPIRRNRTPGREVFRAAAIT